MSGAFVQLASSLSGQEAPLAASAPWHVLIEASGAPGESAEDALQAALADVLEVGAIDDCALAATIAHRHAFWRLRESIPEVLTHLKPTAALDIGMPWTQIAGYMEEVGAALKVAQPNAHHLFLGHLGDNNLHLISGPVDAQGMHEVDDIAYRALQGRHGTISAEHGVGRLKKPYLHMTRSPGEIALMRRLKQAMDPAHILNPGRILDDEKNGDPRCNAEPHSPP